MKTPSMFALLLTGSLLLAGTQGSIAAEPDAAPTASTHQGVVEGRKENGLDVFLGIPFAAAPVHELRWKKPQAVAAWTGTRDRSWGVRPVGASEPQPPPEGNFNQFFWLWTPCNFGDRSLFFHSNDDGAGNPWNQRAVIVSDGGTEQHADAATFTADWQPGSRRIAR